MLKAIWFLTGVLYLLAVYFYIVFCNVSYPTGRWDHDLVVFVAPTFLAVAIPVFTTGSYFLLSPVVVFIFGFARICWFLIISLLRGKEFDLDEYYEKYIRNESQVEDRKSDDDFEGVAAFLLVGFFVLLLSPIYPVGFIDYPKFHLGGAGEDYSVGSQSNYAPTFVDRDHRANSWDRHRRYREVVDNDLNMFIRQRNELMRDNGWDRDRANKAVAGSWNMILTMSDTDVGSADEVSDYILSRLRQNP